MEGLEQKQKSNNKKEDNYFLLYNIIWGRLDKLFKYKMDEEYGK